VWHWHGASPGMYMTHLAIQQTDIGGAEASWGQHVDDAEYLVGPSDS
jgi:hypothetical protein